MKETRPSFRAGSFYPAGAGEARRMFDEWESDLSRQTADPSLTAESVCGGLVPHAGWIFSGAVAFRMFSCLASNRSALRRVVLLGAVHVPGVLRPALGDWDAWQTPLGPLPVDRELEEDLIATEIVERSDRAHRGEHSIEVQLPLILRLMQEPRIVPIAVPPMSKALELGATLGEVLRRRGEEETTAVVASSDLTHYGSTYYGFAPAGTGKEAVEFAWDNDERFLDCVRELDGEGALKEARENRNACGSGAVAAALECAKTLGARQGVVVEHTSSLRVKGEDENFVGYAAAVFV